MVVLIALLGLAVVYLAVRSPDPNVAPNKETLPPNDNVPMLGSVGNPSPAMSNGTPVASQIQRLAMSVNAGMVGNAAPKFTASGNVRQLNVAASVLKPPTQTVSEMGKTLMTAAPPSLTTSTNSNPLNRQIKL